MPLAFGGLSDKRPLDGSDKNRGEQAGPEVPDLTARVPQAGDLHDCECAKLRPRACGEVNEVHSSGGDVLAHLTWRHVDSQCRDLSEQFDVEKVDLTQIGLARVLGHPGPILHRHSEVRVTAHPEAFDEFDAVR